MNGNKNKFLLKKQFRKSFWLDDIQKSLSSLEKLHVISGQRGS